MTTSDRVLRRCFISAPGRTDPKPLQSLLSSFGVEVIDSRTLTPGNDVIASISDSIETTDFLCLVLPAKANIGAAMFEAGIAAGLGKPLLLVAEPGSEIPMELQGATYVRAKANDISALRFFLTAFLSHAGDPKSLESKPPVLTMPPMDVQWAQQALHSISTGEAMSSVVQRLFDQAGFLYQVQGQEKGADFAVWMDSLTPILGSPILVELKIGLLHDAAVQESEQQLRRYLSETGTRTGLLIYHDLMQRSFQPSRTRNWPLILRFSLRELLELLRDGSLQAELRNLRNRAMHGI